MKRILTTAALAIALAAGAAAQNQPAPASSPFDGVRFREIGPATPSGRIDDFAVKRVPILLCDQINADCMKQLDVRSAAHIDPTLDDLRIRPYGITDHDRVHRSQRR